MRFVSVDRVFVGVIGLVCGGSGQFAKTTGRVHGLEV